MAQKNYHPGEKIINDLNLSLGEYDRLIDVICSNLQTLSEELHKRNSGKELIVKEYFDIISFKMEALYFLLIKLEELVFSTTFAYYRKYHGSIRGEISYVEFSDVKREVSYIFDSFLAQYKSLLDIAVKLASNYVMPSSATIPERLFPDSFGKLVNLLTKRDKANCKIVFKLLEKSGQLPYFETITDSFLIERIPLEEINNYRNYIIHHGYVSHQLKGKSVEGHVIFYYLIPKVIKTNNTYKKDTAENIRLNYFCREKLYLLLSLIAELTDLLYDDSLKRQYLDKLNTFEPESVKNVLLRISKKDYWADKLFVREEEFKQFLKSKGIDFSELVEEVTFSEAEKDQSRALMPIFEKTHYKPIGNLRVFRTRFVVPEKAETETKRLQETSYAITLSSLGTKGTEDYVSKNPHFLEIIDTLHRAGLAYVIRTKDETRYASVRDDLKSLIYILDDLSHFKWSFIQIPEMSFFRDRTPSETETTRKILGEKTDAFLKEEDENKERLHKEYAKWRKETEHFYKNCLDITDKEGKIITRITHRDYVEERKKGFKNWKQNKHIHYLKIDGKEKMVTEPLLEGKMTPERFTKLLKACPKIWKSSPKHFLESEKERLRKNKRKYKKNIAKVKEESKSVVERYNYLIPILKLLNKDVFD